MRSLRAIRGGSICIHVGHIRWVGQEKWAAHYNADRFIQSCGAHVFDADSKVIKLVPEKSVAKLAFGAPIRLTADQFERLSAAFLAEIESRFL